MKNRSRKGSKFRPTYLGPYEVTRICDNGNVDLGEGGKVKKTAVNVGPLVLYNKRSKGLDVGQVGDEPVKDIDDSILSADESVQSGDVRRGHGEVRGRRKSQGGVRARDRVRSRGGGKLDSRV